ncbi:CSC1-like protein At4g02900 [Hibiscus syriacus]|uniref:CSC1-like protein At4g02900 n=1 Tax=Hibiscus syriacus TaxID=106335 RepID=UPI001920C240|nr:CSC1-like protein At4g02900 [Hibiscus syriacus]
MASLRDIATAAAINLLSAFGFLMAFAILRIQPFNDRVYFPKWYKKGIRSSPTRSGGSASKFVNLDCRTYCTFLNWMPAALRMPEPELVEHAGLDSVAYIRIYLLGHLKIFVPLAVMAFAILAPVNWTGDTLERSKDIDYSDIDKLSISNVPDGSNRLWAHIIMSYLFSFWTFYMLYSEYGVLATMRLDYLASELRRPDQFTVLVQNIPPDPDESVSEHVQHFFRVNHPDHYLTHQIVYNANKLAALVAEKRSLQNWYIYYQNKYERTSNRPTTKTGFMGLWGAEVDAIDHYTSLIQKLSEEEAAERERVSHDPDSIVPAAFVSFKSRWGAAVCAQTQQNRNPTIWLTEWAPEPRDVYWDNFAIPYFELTIRRLIVAVALFFLIFFFMIPITFVQSLANLEEFEKFFPFLKPLIQVESVKSVIQGFLPGIALKIFLALLPKILMTMSIIEGYPSFSSLDRRSAAKYHMFILVNIFLGSVITGSALQQLKTFLEKPPTEIPETIGEFIPLKANFFITYIMVDGWAGIAAESLRLVPLILFHLKNAFLVKTEQDRAEAMDPGCIDFAVNEPRIQLYILLGLVYSPITPLLLPFIIIFLAFAYVVFRNQIINVYDQKYESAAAFWPDVHKRIIISLIISQLLLLGLLSTKKIGKSYFAVLPLPVLTIWFYAFCKGRFESAFVKFPLQEAMIKDTLERATEPNFNLKAYLKNAYMHPVFKGTDMEKPLESLFEEEGSPLVPTTRIANKQSPSSTASPASSQSHT